LVRYGASTE